MAILCVFDNSFMTSPKICDRSPDSNLSADTNSRTVCHKSWWRHQMETFSALLTLCVGNSPVTGEFATQRPLTRSFHVFFDLRLNKRLSKHSWVWWFETPSCSLWRHCSKVLHLYKSCLLKLWETWSWNSSEHDLYKWSTFSLGYQLTRYCSLSHTFPLHWRHNDHVGVSNHQPRGCLLNR